jgi:hypothetical protein
MRPRASFGRKIRLLLAMGIILSLPCVVLGAARTTGGGRITGSTGRARAPIHQQRSHSQRSYPYGFWDVGGFGEEQVIIIQQVQPAPVLTFREPTKNRVYVQPRWVDGGHGVQVSVPGYWIDADQAPKR